jgi:hypothetical protein
VITGGLARVLTTTLLCCLAAVEHITQVLNICSKKQMALKYVNCYPYVPEAFSMCEALDELGW